MPCALLLRALLLIGPSLAPLALSPEPSAAQSSLPSTLPAVRRTHCYNGVGFFRVDRADLNRRLPSGFVARDGSLLGAEHGGHALVALIYYSCPTDEGTADKFLILATPIEDPAVAVDLRPVRWNWYEFGRVVAGEDRERVLVAIGLPARAGQLSHLPFHEGDTESSFTGELGGRRFFEVRAALTRSINFEAQSHRFWHQRPDGRLISTRLDFAYHHAWVGRFRSCSLDTGLLPIAGLSGIQCSGAGVTEAIERLDFDEQVVVWR